MTALCGRCASERGRGVSAGARLRAGACGLVPSNMLPRTAGRERSVRNEGEGAHVVHRPGCARSVHEAARHLVACARRPGGRLVTAAGPWRFQRSRVRVVVVRVDRQARHLDRRTERGDGMLGAPGIIARLGRSGELSRLGAVHAWPCGVNLLGLKALNLEKDLEPHREFENKLTSTPRIVR